MSQAVLLWILGGWFVVAAVASLILASALWRDSRAGAGDGDESRALRPRTANQVGRRRMAA
jgi:hypothetical protein